jgi:putative toxin-antitoxin system antitoxin component (TIGR02293 family)
VHNLPEVLDKGTKRNKPAETPSSGAELLGLRVNDALSLADKIEEGFRFATFLKLQEALNVASSDLARLVNITSRTLARRRAEGRLRPDESDRLLRVTKVYKLAFDLFESDQSAALAWLRRPNRALNGKTPLRLATTDVGAREVERLVTRLEHGVAT